MHNTYTKLMLRQDLSGEVDAAFYEKLEKGAQKKRIPAWKAALIAACICLIIPGCVWAAETIFGVTKVTQTERPDYYDRPGIGLDVVYENLEDYPIEAFPEHLQEMKEGEVIIQESWAAAEKYLGIDLVDNILFTADDTYCPASFGERGKNARCVYGVADGQFFFSSIWAIFKRNNYEYWVEAMVSVEHPTVNKEDIQNYYHGYSITYNNHNNLQVETLQHTTKAGIPVLIVTATEEYDKRLGGYDWDRLTDCVALFAVNNVSYKVHIHGGTFREHELDRYAGPKEKSTAALIEFLDGFVIE